MSHLTLRGVGGGGDDVGETTSGGGGDDVGETTSGGGGGGGLTSPTRALRSCSKKSPSSIIAPPGTPSGRRGRTPPSPTKSSSRATPGSGS
eukprot:COSAG01_NODE_7049_length_3376_cov_32.391822_1_plen_90_part_10